MSALRTDAAARDAARPTGLNDLYGQARYAVGAVESLERKYRLEPIPSVRDHYDEAAASFVLVIQRIGRSGTAGDRALTADLLVRQRAYRQAARRLFAAVDAGDATRVLEIDLGEADPRFNAIQTLVLAAADKHHRAALASVRSPLPVACCCSPSSPSSSSGNVVARTPRGGTLALVEVADTGIGMSAAEQEQVFKRFYRAESAVKQAIRGTGLGLWISKSILEAHGGILGVTGAPGLGTIFTIELPLMPAVPIRAFAAAPDGGPARVLS